MRRKVLNGSQHEAALHIAAWWRLPKATFKQRRGADLRLGQYIWNLMGKDDCSWPELYYEENPKQVEALVFYHFCQGGV